MTNQRQYSFLDRLCINLDQVVRGVLGEPLTTGRSNPATMMHEEPLPQTVSQTSARLMRINHAGEVCAQALYHGQALVSHHPSIKEKLATAAREEGDHLAWCQERLRELNSHTSYLNPIWYTGSFAIGLAAGLWGDQWSLGFLAETEQQVVHHLESHLKVISTEDKKSYAIIQQMQLDEANHRDEARKLGAKELPSFIKKLMKWTSKVMVKTAYWI